MSVTHHTTAAAIIAAALTTSTFAQSSQSSSDRREAHASARASASNNESETVEVISINTPDEQIEVEIRDGKPIRGRKHVRVNGDTISIIGRDGRVIREIQPGRRVGGRVARQPGLRIDRDHDVDVDVDRRGHVVIIGPDGVKKEYKWEGDEKPDFDFDFDFDFDVDDMFDGLDIDDEVAEKIMKRLHGRLGRMAPGKHGAFFLHDDDDDDDRKMHGMWMKRLEHGMEDLHEMLEEHDMDDLHDIFGGHGMHELHELFEEHDMDDLHELLMEKGAWFGGHMEELHEHLGELFEDHNMHFEFRGEGRFIGPDGQVHEFEFDEGDAHDFIFSIPDHLPELMERANPFLQRHLDELELRIDEDAVGGWFVEAPEGAEAFGFDVAPTMPGVWIGVSINEADEAMLDELDVDADVAVMVTQVHDDSPAQKAGVKAGDIIIAVNGEDDVTTGGLVSAVQAAGPGKKLKLSVVRNGKPKELRVTVARRAGAEEAEMQRFRLQPRERVEREPAPAIDDRIRRMEERFDRLERMLDRLIEQREEQPRRRNRRSAEPSGLS